MHLTAEISLYPLKDQYLHIITDFIKRLNSVDEIIVKTTAMSTYVSGEYDAVMNLINAEQRRVFEKEPNCVLVIKFIPLDLNVENGFLDI